MNISNNRILRSGSSSASRPLVAIPDSSDVPVFSNNEWQE